MTAPRLPRLDDLPAEVSEIAATLELAGFETWCVGGALRDRLLGQRSEDVDLATAATPEDVQKLFPRTIAVGIRFGTVGVLDRRRVLHEVTTFRKDVATDGRHAVVEYGATLDEDLARRDFTINALAYHPLRHEWRDPHGGAQDLARRSVRAVGDAPTRFAEDYLRILRAIRFAVRLDFAIAPETWEAAVASAAGLRGLSAERVREEWFKQLTSARSLARLVELWHQSGASREWLPELLEQYPLPSSDPAPRDPVLLTAALCREPGAVLERLRASNEEIARARAVQAGPLEPASVAPIDVRRWMARVGQAVDDLLLLAQLTRGTTPPWASAVAGVRARGEATARGELKITGDDLIALGFPRGPELGQALARLLDLVLEDPSRNSPEALRALAASWR